MTDVGIAPSRRDSHFRAATDARIIRQDHRGHMTTATTPYWLDTPYEPRSALDGHIEIEACVIGGGVGGLSCARRLAQHGIETVLLEADTVAGGASGRNGGFLIAGTA